MADGDADHWDSRYRQASPPEAPSAHPVIAMATDDGEALPSTMLDVACGFGGDGLVMAQRGVKVRFLDVSAIALDHVKAQADTLGLDIQTQLFDTTTEALPVGQWGLISCVHYLDRELLRHLGSRLGPNGRVAVAIATVSNLERHARPPARFLVEPGELPDLLTAHHQLRIVHHSEAWRTNDAHEAWVIAER